jgi:hypothetical protein
VGILILFDSQATLTRVRAVSYERDDGGEPVLIADKHPYFSQNRGEMGHPAGGLDRNLSVRFRVRKELRDSSAGKQLHIFNAVVAHLLVRQIDVDSLT